MHRYEPADPAAMALTDAEATGRPAISMVLLKHTDTHRFVFYTHTTNPKGRDLGTHAHAGLCFHWTKPNANSASKAGSKPPRRSRCVFYDASTTKSDRRLSHTPISTHAKSFRTQTSRRLQHPTTWPRQGTTPVVLEWIPRRAR